METDELRAINNEAELNNHTGEGGIAFHSGSIHAEYNFCGLLGFPNHPAVHEQALHFRYYLKGRKNITTTTTIIIIMNRWPCP